MNENYWIKWWELDIFPIIYNIGKIKKTNNNYINRDNFQEWVVWVVAWIAIKLIPLIKLGNKSEIVQNIKVNLSNINISMEIYLIHIQVYNFHIMH
jgi:hypothetical protein